MQVYNGANNVRAARAVPGEKKQIDYLRPWHGNKEHVYCSTSPDHASTIETYRPRACQSISLQLIRRFIYAIDSARTQGPAGITPSEEIDSFSFWRRRRRRRNANGTGLICILPGETKNDREILNGAYRTCDPGSINQIPPQGPPELHEFRRCVRRFTSTRAIRLAGPVN